MKEYKVLLRLLTQHTKFHQMMGRLEKANEMFDDEQMLIELENVLEMYRELKKESESEE